MWDGGNVPCGAGDPIEHPGRNLQPPIGRVVRKAATEHIPPSLFDHLMNVNTTPVQRMPRIKKLSLSGPVGVLSPCCTTSAVLT